MTEGQINPWATHLPVLLAACAATRGTVLECGCGHNSTVILHSICAPEERELITLESDIDWLDKFRDLGSGWHHLRHVENWRDPPLPLACAVAFIDHGQAPRGPLVARVREIAKYVVMHDSECHYCGYAEPLKAFDWCWTMKKYETWTSIAGMGLPPTWIEAALSPGAFGIPVPYRG